MGRSLLYALAKKENSFSKICLFSSDKVTFPCSLHSTAVAAPRGVTSGHSPLGDELVRGFEILKSHMENDQPSGVEKILQHTTSRDNSEAFRKRYPEGQISTLFLKEASYVATEEAYLFDPQTYLQWLTEKAREVFGERLSFVEEFVTEVREGEKVALITQTGRECHVDQVVFACGSYNRLWKNEIPESRLKTSRPVQGSYLEFTDLNWAESSFSLTLGSDNIVWNQPLKRLYIGSTSFECSHELPPERELLEIYQRLMLQTSLTLPHPQAGRIKVGLREKAQKREPYVVTKNRITFVGGLYKNAFTLAPKMASELSHQLQVTADKIL